MVSTLLTASLAFSPAPPTVADRINARFAAGKPSNNLTAAGVLVHQFDDTEGGDDAMDEKWLPCPATCYGHKCWCASYRDRFSASIINARTPRVPQLPPNDLILFSKRSGGIVFAPNSPIFCSYPADGDTEARVCDPIGKSANCVPGCFTEERNGHSCWCDEIAPRWSCPNGTAPNASESACAWRPNQTATMLQKQHLSNGYNEVIIDAESYAAALPGSLEAIFFLASDECHTFDKCERFARTTYEALLAKYPKVTSKQLPLLSLNVSDPKSPFSCVKC